jgi:hypothetical protein
MSIFALPMKTTLKQVFNWMYPIDGHALERKKLVKTRISNIFYGLFGFRLAAGIFYKSFSK